MLNTKEFPDKAGRIFPPVIAIEYGEVTLKELEEGKKMEFEFSFRQRKTPTTGDVSIFVKVMGFI